jgi:hypothetical protein
MTIGATPSQRQDLEVQIHARDAARITVVHFKVWVDRRKAENFNASLELSTYIIRQHVYLLS